MIARWVLLILFFLTSCTQTSPESQLNRLISSLSSDCDLDNLFNNDESKKAFSFFCGKDLTIETNIDNRSFIYLDEREGIPVTGKETGYALTRLNISHAYGETVLYLVFKKTLSAWKVDYISDFLSLDYSGVPNPEFPYRYRLTESGFLFDSSDNQKLSGNHIELSREGKALCQARIKDIGTPERSALSAHCDLSRFKDGKKYAFDVVLRFDDGKEHNGIIYASVD